MGALLRLAHGGAGTPADAIVQFYLFAPDRCPYRQWALGLAAAARAAAQAWPAGQPASACATGKGTARQVYVHLHCPPVYGVRRMRYQLQSRRRRELAGWQPCRRCAFMHAQRTLRCCTAVHPVPLLVGYCGAGCAFLGISLPRLID